MLRRGAFFLFEGLDRCGKSTQSAQLAASLAKTSKAELIRFPDRTTVIGGLINSYLQSSQELSDQSIHLLFSANRWEASASIEKRLQEGTHLVCDRYAHSGVAYSGAKGLDLSWCKASDRGLPAPDCIFFLDIPVEDAVKRGQYGEERYEKVDFQKKVRSSFLSLQQMDEQQGPSVPWHVLDARKTVEQLQAEIQEIALRVVEQAASKGIDRLWMA